MDGWMDGWMDGFGGCEDDVLVKVSLNLFSFWVLTVLFLFFYRLMLGIMLRLFI